MKIENLKLGKLYGDEENTTQIVSDEQVAKAFSSTIKAIRKYKELSLTEVSRSTGIPFQTIARYENGENIPSFIQMLKITQFFHIHLETILRIGLLQDPDIEIPAYYEEEKKGYKELDNFYLKAMQDENP